MAVAEAAVDIIGGSDRRRQRPEAAMAEVGENCVSG